MNLNGVDASLDAFTIVPRIVAGSYPSQKTGLQGQDSDLTKLCKYLSTTYKKSLIVNLVAEKDAYTIPNDFRDLIETKHVFWKDNNVIAIYELIQLVHCIMSFLRNKGHGVFIHCKHGKGRTGTLVCALLILINDIEVSEANKIFVERRILYKTGVKQKSQLRLLDYWRYLTKGNKINVVIFQQKNKWKILKIKIHSEEPDTSKIFSIKAACIEVYSKCKRLDFKDIGKVCTNEDYVTEVEITQDVCLRVEYKNYVSKSFATISFNCILEKIFQTNMHESLFTLNFCFQELDGVSGTQFKGKKYYTNVALTVAESKS